MWLTIRSHCKDLLGTEDYWRYRELFDKDLFDKDGDENRLIEWEAILKKFDPNDKDVGSSNYEGQANLRDDFENNSKVMRQRVIAYHQLKAFSLYLKDKADLSVAYHKFLVSIYILFCMIYYCNDNIPHHHSTGALQ